MRTKTEIETRFADRSLLTAAKSFCLVGIGGAGMSGLAHMLLRRGLEVRGTDASDSPVIEDLRSLGATIWIGHTRDAVRPGDAVVLSDAIDLASSPEVAAAQSVGAPIYRRSQLLGHLLEGRKLIAVTGTHGKTTTTGMVGAALRSAGLDPTIVVGAEVPEFGGAVVEGAGEWAVAEACEAYDSFHDLSPEIVVLTNLEPDHLDFHGDFGSLRDSVARFCRRAKRALVFCADDTGARDLADQHAGDCRPYTHATWRELAGDLKLRATGPHNLANAGAAMMTAMLAGADLKLAAEGVKAFGGAARRLQVILEGDPMVIDDYAHHPTEVAASLSAIRELAPDRPIVLVFQPHLYSRTAEHLEPFAEALSGADLLVITDIYPAREQPMPGVSAARIAERVTCPVRYVPSRHLLPRVVSELVRKMPQAVVVGMGAGNIGEFAGEFVREWDRPNRRKVAVVYGGDSAEREVSIHSGLAVARALGEKGYEIDRVDATELLLGRADLSRFTGSDRPDCAFLAVHGTHAEDGSIQGLFELLHIPYTGSRILASALALDKQMAKQVLARAGVRVPAGVLIEDPRTLSDVDLPPGPWVVKPNSQGSTVGLSFVSDRLALAAAVERALAYDETALVEQQMFGVEVSVPVLGDRVLPVVEIVPATGVYDFASKYLPGATEEVCPARISDAATREAQRLALLSHRALGCEGATRTDMIVNCDEVVVLEINTLPGLTATSLLPRSAGVAGISFGDLCDWIVRDAWERHEATTQT